MKQPQVPIVPMAARATSTRPTTIRAVRSMPPTFACMVRLLAPGTVPGKLDSAPDGG